MSCDLSEIPLIVLIGSGCLTGIMNAAGGGGTFIAFPALLLLGIPPISANATVTVAIFPGTFSSLLGYIPQLKEHPKPLVPLLWISLLGGAIGSLLLLQMSNTGFIQRSWLAES